MTLQCLWNTILFYKVSSRQLPDMQGSNKLLNKQWTVAIKGYYCSLGAGQGIKKFLTIKKICNATLDIQTWLLLSTLGFDKRQGITWRAEQLLASQDRLCSKKQSKHTQGGWEVLQIKDRKKYSHTLSAKRKVWLNIFAWKSVCAFCICSKSFVAWTADWSSVYWLSKTSTWR